MKSSPNRHISQLSRSDFLDDSNDSISSVVDCNPKFLTDGKILLKKNILNKYFANDYQFTYMFGSLVPLSLIALKP